MLANAPHKGSVVRQDQAVVRLELKAVLGHRLMHDRQRKRRGRQSPASVAQPRAAICSSAALRSTVWPRFSTGRSKGFQASPTTCS